MGWLRFLTVIETPSMSYFSFLDLEKLRFSLHFIELYRKILVAHLFDEKVLQLKVSLLPAVAHGARRTVYIEIIAFDERGRKKRKTLDVVPVRMGQKYVAGKRAQLEPCEKVVAEFSYSGAGVEYHYLIAVLNVYFNAGSVAAVFYRGFSRRGYGTSHSPESKPHTSP